MRNKTKVYKVWNINKNMKLWNKLEQWWDNGMWSYNGRKFSLMIGAVWLYTLLIMGIFNNQANYFGVFLGVLILILDNHNLNIEK